MAEHEEDKDKEEEALEADADLKYLVQVLHQFVALLYNLQHSHESRQTSSRSHPKSPARH